MALTQENSDRVWTRGMPVASRGHAEFRLESWLRDLRPGKRKKPRVEPEVQWLNSPHLGGAAKRMSGQRLGRATGRG